MCENIGAGMSIVDACKAEGVKPGMFFRWMEANPPLRESYARARDLRGELMADALLKRAAEATAEDAHAVRVHVDAMKWAAARLAPKRWGDRAAVEVTGKDGGAVQVDIADRLARLRAAKGDK